MVLKREESQNLEALANAIKVPYHCMHTSEDLPSTDKQL